MKSLLKYVALVCVAAGMASCVQDLNTTPIDPNSSTSFNADRMFTKCYSCMAVIGQSGPGEDSDVEDMDAGMSGFYRTIWYCNDLTADDAFWIWDNDAEAKGLPTTEWTGSSGMIKGIYTRLNLNIKYCNHYLTYGPKETAEDKYRLAEVRWIRAFHYYFLMDLFLYAPFVTTESSDYPHYVSRHELYKWLVDELKALEVELPAQRVQPYRVGKAAAQLLLARIYLNADVYNKYNKDWATGKMWTKAYDAATNVITDNPQHSLVTTPITTDSGFVYTAYQQLFMGDNDRPEIMKEAIFQIYQDGLYTQSYAGSNFLIAGPRYGGMTAWGIESEWHAIRTCPTLVDKFIKTKNIDRTTAEAMIYDEYQMPSQLGDDRAIFCSYGMNTPGKKNFNLSGPMLMGKDDNFYDSWAGLKCTSVYSTASLPKLSPRRNKDWADMDIPMLRLAEAYMIQAEALFRNGDKSGALNIINNTIRDRANAAPLLDLDEEGLLDEWSREFWFEGRRRMDLIRFGRFFGPSADMYSYHWEGRMQKPDGKQFFVSGTPEYMNWFPIPDEDKRSNPNFKTDVEGDVENEFASRGGDGYVY